MPMPTVCFSIPPVLCLETELITTIRRDSLTAEDSFRQNIPFSPITSQSLVNDCCYTEIRPVVSSVTVTCGTVTEMTSVYCPEWQFLSGWNKARAVEVLFLLPSWEHKLLFLFWHSDVWVLDIKGSPCPPLSWTLHRSVSHAEPCLRLHSD